MRRVCDCGGILLVYLSPLPISLPPPPSLRGGSSSSSRVPSRRGWGRRFHVTTLISSLQCTYTVCTAEREREREGEKTQRRAHSVPPRTAEKPKRRLCTRIYVPCIHTHTRAHDRAASALSRDARERTVQTVQ